MKNPFHLQEGLIDLLATFLKTQSCCPLERLEISLKLADFCINNANLVDDSLVYPFEKVVLRLPLTFVWYNNSISVMNWMEFLKLRKSEVPWRRFRICRNGGIGCLWFEPQGSQVRPTPTCWRNAHCCACLRTRRRTGWTHGEAGFGEELEEERFTIVLKCRFNRSGDLIKRQLIWVFFGSKVKRRKEMGSM